MVVNDIYSLIKYSIEAWGLYTELNALDQPAQLSPQFLSCHNTTRHKHSLKKTDCIDVSNWSLLLLNTNMFWHLEPSQKHLPLPMPLVYLPLPFATWLVALTQKNSQLQSVKSFSLRKRLSWSSTWLKQPTIAFLTPHSEPFSMLINFFNNILVIQMPQLVKIGFTTSLNSIKTSTPDIGLLASQLFVGVLSMRLMSISGTNCCKRSSINTEFAQIWYFQWMRHPAFLTSALIQWAKKLIFKRANFACEWNYGPENKGKPVGICGHKGRYLVLYCAKAQNFNTCQSFNINCTIRQTQPISFFASTWFGPRWPLSLPLSFWDLLSTTFLQTLLGVLSHSTSTCPQSSSTPAGGAHRHWAATHIQMGWGWVTTGHFKTMTLIYWNHFGAFWKVSLGSLSCWKVSQGWSNP